MNISPGHQKWPDHNVKESHVPERMRVEVDGNVVAESEDVIRVDEDQHPVRYYFPRSDVHMDQLERTSTTTQCPFKGTAHYFNVNVDGGGLQDAVWTYEDPFDEHKALKDRIAFDSEKFPDIHIKAA